MLYVVFPIFFSSFDIACIHIYIYACPPLALQNLGPGGPLTIYLEPIHDPLFWLFYVGHLLEGKESQEDKQVPGHVSSGTGGVQNKPQRSI